MTNWDKVWEDALFGSPRKHARKRAKKVVRRRRRRAVWVWAKKKAKKKGWF